MRRLIAIPLLLLFAALPGLSRADIAAGKDLVVIVNLASGVTALQPSDAVNIFMGRYRKLPSGIVAFPIDIGDRTPEREQFYQQLVHKSLAEVDAYWARLVFSGQTSPPLQVPDGKTAVQLVAGNRAAIAYVSRSAVDNRVKVVLDLGRKP
jgi:hypothetical protein